MAANDQLIGRRLGSATIIEKIGAGGMGVVYRARQDGVDRDVAVKTLSIPQAGDSAAGRRSVARFLREGQAAATVAHGNVVQVYGSGIEEDIPYLIMEFVDGASLGEAIDEAGALDAQRTSRIGAAIARGIAAIHAKNIVHRDIKPDNVLIGRDGQVKITDLGLAKQDTSQDAMRLTASGVVVGTPLYVAPEAIRDAHRAGPEVDIYSFGASLYHMVCGHPPFDGDSPYELMRAHLEDKPRPVREINPSIPVWLSRAIHACLAKAPEDRPDAKELALVLHQGLDLRRQGGGNQLMVIGLTAVVTLAVAAVVGWRLLGRSDGAGSVPVTIADLGHRLEWRVDQGPWADLAGPLNLVPGPQRLEVRTWREGTLLTWADELDLSDGEAVSLSPNLRPASTRASYRSLPGDGLTIRQGHSIGSDLRVLRFDAQGRYAVALWNGDLVRSTTITVDADGAQDSGWRIVSWPPPEAYFTTTTPLGQVALAHHQVSALELEFARQHANLPAGNDWRMGPRPAQAATAIPLRLLRAWESWANEHDCRLPDPAEASELSALLGTGVWYRDDGRLYYHGPSSSQARLVALPR